jgi:hydroxymethylglutaryl-CoA synthase
MEISYISLLLPFQIITANIIIQFSSETNEHFIEMSDSPKHIGILGMHLYLPATYATLSSSLSSSWASTYENEPASIAILGDREDTVSMGLSALSRLLNKYSINPRDIGRLEVGTSDMTDKSKSIKTYMMSLFRESGNCNVEGVTSHGSSYGAVQAFYNSVAWIESRAWDGRYAVVVAVDCSEDGAGAAALLIGPNAGLVLEKDRAIFMDHEYDQYSPDFSSADIITEGNLHHQTYIESLLECYNLIQQRTSTRELNQLADFFIFHSPSLYISQRALCYLTVRDME